MNDPASSQRSWITLVRAPNLGGRAVRAALTQIGDVDALLRCSRATLRNLGLGEAAATYLGNPPQQDIDSDLAWITRTGARLLPITAPQFPQQLAALPDSPFALYALGDLQLLSQAQIAVVGSRTPTAAGRKFAALISEQLCAAGMVVTSGLARGIDTAAHEGALAAGGGTIAVCGTGLGRCYPAENHALFERIGCRGVLVSEFPPDTPARRQHFPQRNRIISGLARGTVVIEAAADSGSLITARRALDQGREVFAVPGSPLNPLAAGCLDLLRDGAHLVRTVHDILEQIKIPIERNILFDQILEQTPRGSKDTLRLDKACEMLLDALGFEPASIDDLVDRTGFTPGSVASMMLLLELEGRVETRPGALFNRVTER
jgi:DNA processing protein